MLLCRPHNRAVYYTSWCTSSFDLPTPLSTRTEIQTSDLCVVLLSTSGIPIGVYSSSLGSI